MPAKFVMLIFGSPSSRGVNVRLPSPVTRMSRPRSRCVNSVFGLQAHLIGANAVIADSQIVQYCGADHPGIADADVLRAKLRRELVDRMSGLFIHVEGTIT